MITVSDYLIGPVEQGRLEGHVLPGVFEAAVAAGGEQLAVYDGGRARTWRDWWRDARALARALQELGVAKGDVVALHLPNCWEYLIGHVAVAAIGAVTLPIHMAYGEHELRVLLERTSASVLILPAIYHKRDLLTVGHNLLNELPALRHVLLAGGEGAGGVLSIDEQLQRWAGAAPHPVHIVSDDPFALLASSGTTSLRPKICMHSHDSLLSNAAMTAREAQARGDDMLISASPFTHLFGLLSIHLSIFSRGRQALLPSWKTEDFLAVASQADATIAFLVPAQLRDICAYLDAHLHIQGIKLREVRTGGAKVPASLVADVRRVLGSGVIVQWGMSEIGAGTFTRPADPAEAASKSVGRPITNGETLIINDAEEPVMPGETGELCYRSPYLFRGYLHDPELTRIAVSADGWLRTGDLASMNEDGTMSYQGRRTELINRGGLKFSAAEVESLLSDLPQLYQFAIVGRPDSRLGERSILVAAIRAGSTITLADVVAHLEHKGLARYKWPEELILVEALPTTPTGKISRARLIASLDVQTTSVIAATN